MKKFLAITFVTVLAASTTFAQSRINRAIDASFDAFSASARQLGVDQRDLHVRNSHVDEMGVTHVRFDQTFRGVPVFEGEAITHVTEDGDVRLTNALRHVRVSTTPTIDATTAVAKVIAQVSPQGPFDNPTVRLEILPAGRVAEDHLVWHVTMHVDNEVDGPAQWEKFVDAHTGDVVFEFNGLETAAATGTGNAMYLGNVSLALDFASGTYSMKDSTRGGFYTTDLNQRQNGTGTIFSNTTGKFGNGKKDSSDRSTAGVDAHYGVMMTWDFYKTKLGRTGIDGTGTKASYNRVHYGRNYENAFWSDSCFCMTYGDGATTFYPLVSIDVAGHEMSHGVMSREANLTYSGESGGLNEANSDMMGTMVEFYANNAADTPDWWIGEKIYKSNYSTGSYVQSKALRYMNQPSLDGRSPNCWSSTVGSLDVHYSSGPANHMFYLLANGGKSACNGATVNGVGNDIAAKIWYNAVANYMTSSTNYAGARAACLSSASALYGAGSTQYAAVAAAFSAINVN